MKKFKQNMIAKNLERALSIDEGIVRVDEISCDGCKGCVDTCPHSALFLKALTDDEVKKLPFKGRLKVMIKGNIKAYINQDLCTGCGQCMKQCHEFAIHKTGTSKPYSLAG